MSQQSLEDKLQAAGSAADMARNSQIGPYVYPAVPAEFSNWRDEQVAWRETSALFDQSHHMTDLQISGPDTIELLSHVGVNTFGNFAVDKAKQLVVCNQDGYVIGDAILFHLDENKVRIVGRPSAHNWVQYHAETGDYDVEVSRDERTAVNPTGGRELYRFQVQGPTALDVLKKANGGSLPEIKFFNMGELTLGGHKGARAAPWHVGRSRPRALGAVGGARGRQGGDRRGRSGLRAAPGRVTCVRHEHPRVRLDPVPAARGLHGRRDEGLPGVAPGVGLRGDGLAGR
jgi:glycine cleavage system aminomethyltransferase T